MNSNVKHKDKAILLLVDSLPAPQDPDPLYLIKNSFVLDIMKAVAKSYRIVQPLLVPYLPNLILKIYEMRGMELHFPAARREMAEGIGIETVKYFYLPRKYTANKTHQLLSALKRGRQIYNIIHCHTIFDLGVVGLELRKKLSLPLVVSVYGSDINLLFESGANRPAENIVNMTTKVLREADAVTCVSQDLAEKVTRLGADKKRVFWIPNGFDQSIFYYGDAMEALAETVGLEEQELEAVKRIWWAYHGEFELYRSGDIDRVPKFWAFLGKKAKIMSITCEGFVNLGYELVRRGNLIDGWILLNICNTKLNKNYSYLQIIKRMTCILPTQAIKLFK